MQWGDPVSPFAPAVSGARGGDASAQALPIPGGSGAAGAAGLDSMPGPAISTARQALLAELQNDVDELQVRPHASARACWLPHPSHYGPCYVYFNCFTA